MYCSLGTQRYCYRYVKVVSAYVLESGNSQVACFGTGLYHTPLMERPGRVRGGEEQEAKG